MKKWKTWQIVLFVLLCVSLNVGGRFLATGLELPLWLDSFGTALCACIGGPVCGAMVGLTGNLAYGMVRRLSMVYALTSIALGVIIGIAARRKWFDRFYGFMKAASLSVAVALLVSVPLNILFSNGYTGNVWGNGIIDYFLDEGWPALPSCILGQLAIEFADKVLTVLAVYLVILLRRQRRSRRQNQVLHFESTAVTLLILSLCLWGSARAETAERPADYNDYVQTVYSSNNGLPCGEANDIAQTNDGVLWIGTYAGLYRYNGREFRWVDNYESVRNVNCLYVDEEGRLWIGTNDNGLAIVIREKVVNVLDQSTGLPSNSVKCIIRSSDGYYYVGTTGSLQMLIMNNGLKVANTLHEINYADSITADDDGHVALIASGGRLFLLEKGNILCSMMLMDDQELYNCCAFAPDGTLMVGSSTNHIYHYDISGGDFTLLDVISCEDVTNINNLNYLDDGTLFISADSGVSCMDTAGYHRINTNDFNNSIDNMLCDYQGNLWFTSSRLGLLRLARSAFRDVYGAIGMERRVVNAVVKWQDCYYIGTDNGLDVVDSSCHSQITNELTRSLEGKRIRCMYVDTKDHLWVCTYGNGLMEFSPEGESWTYNATSGSFGNRARLVTEISDGTILAAGNTGISYIRDHAIQRTIRNEDGLINSMILTATEMSDGTILAGTDGDGIAVLKNGEVARILTREDGLSSGVILRTVKDPKSEGVFIVTSNSLCYLDPEGSIRMLDRFPYFNNYDIWVKDEDTLFVMSSAGIYVVGRDELVSDSDMAWELLDARRGLGTSLTANSWNYYDGSGKLFLPCDTGVYIIDVDKYDSDVRSYRMQLASIRLDGVLQPPVRSGHIDVEQGVSRVELSPEILNYTIQDPNAGYYLEGYDTLWTIVPQSSLNSIIYTNLPAGKYAFHLAIFDSAGERVLEERVFSMTKEGEMYERPGFRLYMVMILTLFIIWFTWLVVQRQLNKQQIKLNMANETVMAIANAVDAKDVRTSQHSMRVAEYSVLLASEMKCFRWWQRRKMLNNLRRAAQMHDIGKIAIKDDILNSTKRLSDKEYVEMKSHVTRGADILKDFTLVENVVDGTKYHHERYDGKGYPCGLKGEEIPLFARIIGVADTFDAMTSNRVYRPHMDADYVMNEMKRGRGTQFDPVVLDAFLRLVDKNIINLKEIYEQRQAEIQSADPNLQAELKRRAEEDKQIQAEAIKSEEAEKQRAEGDKQSQTGAIKSEEAGQQCAEEDKQSQAKAIKSEEAGQQRAEEDKQSQAEVIKSEEAGQQRAEEDKQSQAEAIKSEEAGNPSGGKEV